MLIRCVLIGVFAASPPTAQTRATTPAHPDPHALIAGAIDAMGGRDRLAAMKSYRTEGLTFEFGLGNGERAEGPWRTQYAQFTELWDVEHDQMRRSANNPANVGSARTVADLVYIITDTVAASQSGGRISPLYAGTFEDIRARMNASPQRALVDAMRSTSLTWDKSVSRFGVTYDVVSFRRGNEIERVEIARTSHLPTAVEILSHSQLDFRRLMFGDAVMRVEYEDWNSQLNGLWWPMQARYYFNGELFRDMSLSKIDQTAVATPDSFTVADSTRAAYVKSVHSGPNFFKLGDRPEPKQVGDDIVRLADNWAMTLVKQDDGVVVFEAHLSDQYIKQVVEEVHRRWPGVPIKAFVLTSDPWAHLGGLRQVVALGYPIYVNGASIPFLKMIAARPFTLDPDALAKSPKPTHFIPVTAHTVIGSGKNQIDLYPVGGAYGERMTMAYFPARKLLYAADLVFPYRVPAGAPPPTTTTFSRTPALDLIAAVNRAGIKVDSLFCVQATYPILSWATFVPAGEKP